MPESRKGHQVGSSTKKTRPALLPHPDDGQEGGFSFFCPMPLRMVGGFQPLAPPPGQKIEKRVGNSNRIVIEEAMCAALT